MVVVVVVEVFGQVEERDREGTSGWVELCGYYKVWIMKHKGTFEAHITNILSFKNDLSL